MATLAMASTEEFVVPKQKRKATGRKGRIYIGNLPADGDNLEADLRALLENRAVVYNEISMVHGRGNGVCHAFVSSSTAADQVVSKLQGITIGGNQLVVQRENNVGSLSKRPLQKRDNRSAGFRGKKGWSVPSEASGRRPQTRRYDHDTSASLRNTETFGNEVHVDNNMGRIGEVVSSEIATSEGDPPKGDALVSIYEFGGTFPSTEEGDHTNKGGLLKKSLPELFADYGEQDLTFKVDKQTGPESKQLVEVGRETPRQATMNRLAPHGKAPIHVEFMSYGYNHGVPPEAGSGWSHAFPILFDCRDLPQAPHYMQRQDGRSGNVKRALLNSRRDEGDGRRDVWGATKDLGRLAFEAVAEAIRAGHGHAAPLRMTVCVGSETGRHRGVVVAELGATALRKRLRASENDMVTTFISVGTRHRDIDRRPKDLPDRRNQSRGAKPKQEDLESDWS